MLPNSPSNLSLPTKENPLSVADDGWRKKRAKGLEPSTSSLGSNTPPIISGNQQEVALSTSAVCTPVCTSEGELAHSEAEATTATVASLEGLVAALLQLPADERASLIELISRQETTD
jgi:hypothetical protein